jgi:hypothetical protein
MAESSLTPAELERFRSALAAAIARSSLRAVARKVGMSPTGLTNFVGGKRPYGKTVERVRYWYYREAGLSQLAAGEIAELMRRMVGTLPEPDAGVVHLLGAVAHSYHAAGMHSPDWVRDVRRLLQLAADVH